MMSDIRDCSVAGLGVEASRMVSNSKLMAETIKA